MQQVNLKKNNFGFTVIEILISVSILAVLAYLAVIHFSSQRDELALRSAVEDLKAVMEEVKAESLAGKDGEAQGVKFNADSYVHFGGSSYSAGAGDNVSYEIGEDFTISTTLNGDETIIFNRLSGAVGSTATITVASLKDEEQFEQVVVGKLGDITIVR